MASTATITEADIPRLLATIRAHESGNNYTIRSRYSSASGAYQFINATWKGAGGTTPTAADASPAEQDRVAANYVRRILEANDWDLRAVFKTWYVGGNKPDDFHPGGAGNTLTAGQYADKAIARYEANGGEVAAASSSPSSSDALPGESAEDYARRTYGYFAAFLDHPEIGPILRQAAAEEWTLERLQGALTATDWWKGTNAAAREWLALTATDPQTAQSQINGRQAEIQARAAQLGLNLRPERARLLAEHSLQFGWQGAELDRVIGAEGAADHLLESGFGRRYRQMADSYGVPMGDEWLGTWAKRVAMGQQTEDQFRQYLIGQAKGLYPQLAGAIDGGTTVEEFFDPYRQIAARRLEVPVESIKLSDPKWGSALAVSDGKGGRTFMNLDQWDQQLKSNPVYGWQNTNEGREAAYEFSANLGRLFGQVS